jgi:hypothetical protein
MENNQNIVFRFSKINTRIKLIVLWVSLIILYNYTKVFYSFFNVITHSPVARIIYHNIYLKTQSLLNQLIIDYSNGIEMSRIKLFAVDVLSFLTRPEITYFLAEILIILTPVLIIIANIFIKKDLINKINIIVGFIYAIISFLILLDSNNFSRGYFSTGHFIICIVEILILFIIIIISILWLKIKEE